MQTRSKSTLVKVSKPNQPHPISTSEQKICKKESIIDVFMFAEPNLAYQANNGKRKTRQKSRNYQRKDQFTMLKDRGNQASKLADVYDFDTSPASILRHSYCEASSDESAPNTSRDESPRNNSRVSFSEDSIRLTQNELKAVRGCQNANRPYAQTKCSKTSTPIHAEKVLQSKAQERCSFDELISASPILSNKKTLKLKIQPINPPFIKQPAITTDISYSDILVEKKCEVSSQSGSSGYASHTSTPGSSGYASQTSTPDSEFQIPTSSGGRKRPAGENTGRSKGIKKKSQELLRIQEKEKRYLQELQQLDKFSLCIA